MIGMFGLNFNYSEKKFCYAQRNLAFNGYHYEKCQNCGRSIAKLVPTKQMDEFVVEGGMQYPDFLDYRGAGINFLVSNRVLQAFIKNGITGYTQAVKVPIRREHDRPHDNQGVYYNLLDVVGRVDFDLKTMGLKRKNICPFCEQFDWSRQRLSIIKTVLDMNTWDKSDLCRISSFPGFVVCSEKLKSIIDDYSFSGVVFQNEDRIFQIQ